MRLFHCGWRRGSASYLLNRRRGITIDLILNWWRGIRVVLCWRGSIAIVLLRWWWCVASLFCLCRRRRVIRARRSRVTICILFNWCRRVAIAITLLIASRCGRRTRFLFRRPRKINSSVGLTFPYLFRHVHLL